jgi:osmotically inducible lipoprotein OsmB
MVRRNAVNVAVGYMNRTGCTAAGINTAVPTGVGEFICESILDKEAVHMNAKAIPISSVGAILATLVLGGCAGMTPQQHDTAVGAAVGGVAGSVLTGGSAAGTVGGAAVGGIVGHETSKNKK